MLATVEETTTIHEGKTTLIVPANGEVRKIPYFFNPKGAFVRNVSNVCYDAFCRLHQRFNLTFADSLCGVGARGIRVANEIESVSHVFLNDVNSKALTLARESARLNNVEEKCVFSKNEICSFLLSRTENNGERFDIVDVDPFGTPGQFVDCAIRSVRHEGLISLTATDSAVLCGVYPKVCVRKYLGVPLRTDYCHEIGLRLMFGLLALTAMRLDTGIIPLFAHHDMHYFRIYAQLEVGNNYSIENEASIGYVLHCFRCGFRTTTPRSEFASPKNQNSVSLENMVCPNCQRSSTSTNMLKLGGPCWIGNIQSMDFVKKCLELSSMQVFSAEELDIPLYYDLTAISQQLGTRTPRIIDVMKELDSSGFKVSRTRLNPNALRTDAPLPHLLILVSQLAR